MLTNSNIKHYVTIYCYFFEEKVKANSTRGINGENVVNMPNIFKELTRLPKNLRTPIGQWDVSNVTNMENLFEGYTSTENEEYEHIFFENFNQPLNDWDVSNVTNMSSMFSGCKSFNQPLNSWDVSNVISMNFMFRNCESFNQSLNNWEVFNINDVSHMFYNCKSFNQQPLNNWYVSNVTDMSFMFSGCENFNQPLDNWDVSNVENMASMFLNCTLFNQPLNNWDVSNVTDMSFMFSGCENFNQPLDNWDVSNVENMASMFLNCRLFNQPLIDWDIDNNANRDGIFQNTSMTNENLPIMLARRRVAVNVDAQQIHREFAKINSDKLNELFIRSGVIFNNNEELNANFIRNKLTEIIQSLDVDQTNKNNKMNGLEQIMTERLNGTIYSDFNPSLKKTLILALKFVQTLPSNAKELYIDSLFQDCIHAYEGVQGMSCSMGILERIVKSLEPACSVDLSNSNCKDIVDVLTNNPKAKMLELIKEWYQMYNMHKIDTDRNVAQFHKMTIEQKINNLRDFLKQKFQESGLNDDAFIDDYLQNKIDRTAFEEDDFIYGGSKKKKNKKK